MTKKNFETIRIYCELVSFNDYISGAFGISLTPFETDCYYIDLEPDCFYNVISCEDILHEWKPYNTIMYLSEFLYNPTTKDVIEVFDQYEDSNGNLIYLGNEEIKASEYSDYNYLEEYKLTYKEGVLISIEPC